MPEKHGQRRCAVTDREKLQLANSHTTQYEFGQACDFVKRLGLDAKTTDLITSRIRTHGNNIIRILNNHLDAYNVTKKHKAPVDANRIADRVIQQEEG